MPNLYLPRRLAVGDNTLSERECLAKRGVIVVLAEPGAGKSDLLSSFGRETETRVLSARRFAAAPPVTAGNAVIVDAMDELARQDATALDSVIVRAIDLAAPVTVFASRASEWDSRRNRFITECTGAEPIIVHFRPLQDDEQRLLFASEFPGDDFAAFHSAATRFGLAPLLGNPMFLKLFAGGYIQGGRSILSRRQIFKDAIDRLALDDGKTAGTSGRPPLTTIIAIAGDVFIKLLLSGAAGVSTTDHLGDIEYPYFPSLLPAGTPWQYVLNSRLFKPGTEPDSHDPYHRIVAEYCAAAYLARRLDDPKDRLSLKRCLAVIAPNGAVRDDLRGLIGWLAALGGTNVQHTLVT